MGEVVPIRSTEDALSLVRDWQRECQHEAERAEIMTLLYLAYKLMLEVEQRESARLREFLRKHRLDEVD